MAQRIVGLDIGTSAIRAVELTINEGARPSLVSYGQVGLHPGAVIDGEIRDHAGVVQALQRLWSEGGFEERKVIVGIAGLRAITRELDMPTLPPDELNDAVKFKADEVIPFPLDRSAISSKVIAQYTDPDGAPTIRVLVAAAHLDLIEAIVRATQDAGLEPVGIDLNTAALVRALYDPTFTAGPEAIISVGAGLTLVVVHQAGLLQFVRTIDLAGESITESIASALDIPIPDAEAVKRKLSEPGIADARAQSACRQAVAELVSEIHNSIRFFASLPGRSPVARVLVTGAGAYTQGFLPQLQEGLNVPVSLASPLSLIDISQLPITPEEAAAINPNLAVPVGLGIPDPSATPFNLLPAEVAKKAEERRTYRLLAIVGIVLVVLLIGLSVLQAFRVHSAAGTVSTLNEQINVTKTVTIPKYNKAVILQKNVEASQAQLVPVLSGVVDMLTVLNQLGQYQPKYAVYNSISISSTASGTPTPGGAIQVGTVSINGNVPTGPQAADWAEAQIPSPAFVGVTESAIGAPSGSSGISFSAGMGLTERTISPLVGQLTKPITAP